MGLRKRRPLGPEETVRGMIAERRSDIFVAQSDRMDMGNQCGDRFGIRGRELLVIAGIALVTSLGFGLSGVFGDSSSPTSSALLAALPRMETSAPAPQPASADSAAPASAPLAALPASPSQPSAETQPSTQPQPAASAKPAASPPAQSSDDLTRDKHPSTRGGNRPLTPEEQFFTQYAESAQVSQRETGVPASVTLAQAALESDWGKSQLARQGNNFFGIKATKQPGTAGVIQLPTWEVLSGSNVVVQAGFRAYQSAAESFADHGRFFIENARYAAAMKNIADPNTFARLIHQAGYATDPAYATKLIGLMQKFNLYQYDAPPAQP